jgi:hypothetical protein
MEYELKLQTERYKLIQEATNDNHFEYLSETYTLYLYIRDGEEIKKQ